MGNERVDKLAGQGRDTGLRVGGRQLVLRDLTTRPSSSSVSADVFVDRLRMAAEKSIFLLQSMPPAHHGSQRPHLKPWRIRSLQKLTITQTRNTSGIRPKDLLRKIDLSGCTTSCGEPRGGTL